MKWDGKGGKRLVRRYGEYSLKQVDWRNLCMKREISEGYGIE